MQLQRVDELKPEPLAWLWQGRLALGKVAMLDGDPGLGKSLLALDLCARLSTGRPMPDGSPGPGAGVALVLNAEDGPEDTTRPRLEALGADLGRVFVLRPSGELGSSLRLPGDTRLLDAALEQTRARLLIIDPVVAFLDASAFSSSDQGVRRALLPLVGLAARNGCAVWLIRHLNKMPGGRALYRGGGSIGFLGACRSGWLVGRDPKEPERRVLAQVKNNLGMPQPSLAFAVEGTGGAARLNWLGPSPLTADELLVGGGPALPAARRDRASDFLGEFLVNGPRTSREIWEAARKQGLSVRTLYRAREEMQVRVHRVAEGKSRLNYWLLPGQVLPVRPADEDADLEPWLAPLREQFPSPTPLDDI